MVTDGGTEAGADGVTERIVLAAVRSALARAGELSSHDDLVVLHHGPTRRRSSLYFLGLADHGPECRWVVKRPHSTVRQVDLSSPLPASGQFAALQRLHEHLQRVGGRAATPLPVADLPEIDGYVMEYVAGRTVTGLISARALIRPTLLLDGVATSAAVLRAVHSLERAGAELVDLHELAVRTATRARRVLAAAELPSRERWFAAAPGPGTTSARTVLLHGDFAPENVVLSSSGPHCLDPDLQMRGWPEHDVVRFLLMLFDAPMFVAGADLPPIGRLRRDAAVSFLRAFYGAAPAPETLRPLMVLGVATRWSTRHTDVTRREARLRRARQMLLRRHFTTVLDEVSSWDWPRLLR